MKGSGARRWALAALVLPVLMMSGCSLLGASSGKTGTTESMTNGVDLDGDSWIVSDLGKATPSPVPVRGAGTRSPDPSGFLPRSTATPSWPDPAPGACAPGAYNFSQIHGLEVTPGTTSAVLTWNNFGGYNLVEYRMYAISQDLVTSIDLNPNVQPDVGFVTIKPANACGEMSGTVVNLTPKTTYVFSVDAVVTRRSGDGTHAATVFRSQPIVTK